jgi:hypothetical protein
VIVLVVIIPFVQKFRKNLLPLSSGQLNLIHAEASASEQLIINDARTQTTVL